MQDVIKLPQVHFPKKSSFKESLNILQHLLSDGKNTFQSNKKIQCNKHLLSPVF